MKSKLANVPRKAMLISSFCILVVTINPKLKTANIITAPLPHWPGLIQALPVNRIATTIPNADGLKICFPFILKMYFERMETDAAKTATHQLLVFNKRHSPKDEIKTEGIPYLILSKYEMSFFPEKYSHAICTARPVAK